MYAYRVWNNQHLYEHAAISNHAGEQPAQSSTDEQEGAIHLARLMHAAHQASPLILASSRPNLTPTVALVGETSRSLTVLFLWHR